MDKQYKILIIEETKSILTAFYNYFNTYFDVSIAPNFSSAKKIIQENRKKSFYFHLILSDIHLSDGTAFSLIKYCREYSPKTIMTLMTSHNINNYIKQIYEEGINHIISKQSNLSLKYVHAMLNKILTSDIFGIQKYFSNMKVYYPLEIPTNKSPNNKELLSVTIHSPEDRIYWVNKITNIFHTIMNIPKTFTKLILEEITINAMLKAARYDDQTYKFQEKVEGIDHLISKKNIQFSEEDYFIIQYGMYNNFMILVCQDHHGTLRRKEILYRLKRHITINAKTGLPNGLYDSHGRGFFLLRERLTSLIVNIKKNHKTEIICLYNKKHDTVYKNISVFEIE